MIPTNSHSHAPARPVTPPAVHPPVAPLVPTLLYTKNLPGPLSMRRLEALGSVVRLDDSVSYWCEHASTLYGRAAIVSATIPFNTTACALTAAWVWVGGSTFPDTLDVLSDSHYRTPSAGRRIRSFRRSTDEKHITTIGNLSLTSPARTACDLAMMPATPSESANITAIICTLMSTYNFHPKDCLEILKKHRHHKFAGQAKDMICGIQADLANGTLELQA